MKIRGIDCIPNLVRQVQDGKVTNTQMELLIEELHVKVIVVITKELNVKMKYVLFHHEHLNPKNEEVKKFVHPKIFTAADWSKDVLASSL